MATRRGPSAAERAVGKRTGDSWASPQHHQRQVVLEVVASGEAPRLEDHALDQVSRSKTSVRRDTLRQPVRAEALARGAARLDDAVGEDHHLIARGDADLTDLELSVVQEPEQRTAAIEPALRLTPAIVE